MGVKKQLTIVAVLLVFIVVAHSYYHFVSAQAAQPAIISQIEGKQAANGGEFDDLTLPEVMQKKNVPGISVTVVQDFKIHWSKSYGVADVETNAPVGEDTLFQAASISKPVTALAFMKAVQDGRATLDGDVNKLLKSWRVPASEFNKNTPVTPRSLFSHTSGADDGLGFPGYAPSQPRPTLLQILAGEKPANTKAVTFARPPFLAAKYSGGGLTIMQLAMMDFWHQPFAAIMQKSVLTPLGMTNSTYEQPIPAAWEKKTSRAHTLPGKAGDVKWHVYPEQAAAGLWTTSHDLALFMLELQKALAESGSKVLNRKTAQEMITPVGVGSFAVGLVIEKRGEGWYFNHSGGNWGFRCDLRGHIRKGYGVVIMTNGDNGGAVIQEFEARVARAYKWDSLDKPLPR